MERQTDPQAASATVAFRTSSTNRLLIAAAAAKRGEIASEWLRRTVASALQNQLGLQQVEQGWR